VGRSRPPSSIEQRQHAHVVRKRSLQLVKQLWCDTVVNAMLQVKVLLDTVLLVCLVLVVFLLHLLGDSLDALIEVVHERLASCSVLALLTQGVQGVCEFVLVILVVVVVVILVIASLVVFLRRFFGSFRLGLFNICFFFGLG
jgi:hypothetical protein